MVRKISDILNIQCEEISSLKSINSEFIDKINDSLSYLSSTESHRKLKYNNFIHQIDEWYKEKENNFLVIKSIINTLDVMIYVKNTKNQFVLANTAFKKVLKLDHNLEVKGKTDDFFFSLTESKSNLNEDKQVINKGTEIRNKEAFIPGSKKKKFGLITKKRIMDSQNKPLGMICSITDITENKKNEIIKELLSEAVDNLNISLGICDINKEEYIYKNKNATSLFGINSLLEGENLLEYWLNNIVHPEDRASQLETVPLLKQEQMPTTRKYRIIHPKLGIRWIKVYTTRVISYLNKKI